MDCNRAREHRAGAFFLFEESSRGAGQEIFEPTDRPPHVQFRLVEGGTLPPSQSWPA